MGWFHINVLNEVMEQVALDDFVIASSPCESASSAPHSQCAARFCEAWCSLLRPAVASKHQQATGLCAGCQVMCDTLVCDRWPCRGSCSRGTAWLRERPGLQIPAGGPARGLHTQKS